MVLHDCAQSLLVSRIQRLERVNRLPRRAFGTALVAGVGERFEHRGVPGRNPDVLGRTAGNEIAQVGTSSANGDRAIGKMIAEAMKRVGSVANFAADGAPV